MKRVYHFLSLGLVAMLGMPLAGQTCSTASDMEATTRSALEQTGRQLFRMTVSSQTEALRQSAVPSLAGNFGGITAAVAQNNPQVEGSQPELEGLYLLDASGAATLPRTDFYCGVFNSPDRVAFSLNNLAPGQYAIAIFNSQGGKKPYALTYIMQELNGGWKLAGLYMLPKEAAGHDGNWYLEKARAYKAAGELHAAWFYYMLARELLAPVSFMSTPTLDKIYAEQQQSNPGDLPAGNPVALNANGRTYELTDVFPSAEMGKLYLVVRYKSSGEFSSTGADNLAVSNAFLGKYPELRNAFTTVVAQAE